LLLQVNVASTAIDESLNLQAGATPLTEGEMRTTAPAAITSAVLMSLALLLVAADAQAKGGSPGWHGLTYHGATLATRGTYACEASGRAHLARPRICRIGH
jgi:hypothetical protein